MAKVRADILLVERGLAESRAQAQRLVMAGQVRADGQVVDKPSSMLAGEERLEVEKGPRYVSRGGEKLEAALEQFKIDVAGKVCADVGASTGGFTDCLLQHGASKVYAIDVGKGQLDWKLRQDARVVVMEETNARHVDRLPESVDLVTVDASFISLKTLLPAMKGWLTKDGQLIALIKPQFEAGKAEVGKGKGVIRDEQIHRRVLEEIFGFVEKQGFRVLGVMRSPLLGPKGNVEFLGWARKNGEEIVPFDKLLKGLF
ncbi:MAG: TlyA family RNA methyltransferase [Chloroflexi bacterium]|nr:TlyA family RNA methyltransferase [Chloroflexota bacterium]